MRSAMRRRNASGLPPQAGISGWCPDRIDPDLARAGIAVSAFHRKIDRASRRWWLRLLAVGRLDLGRRFPLRLLDRLHTRFGVAGMSMWRMPYGERASCSKQLQTAAARGDRPIARIGRRLL